MLAKMRIILLLSIQKPVSRIISIRAPQGTTTYFVRKSTIKGLSYTGRFPQQLPGPAQSACPGDKPQHAVSPGPGIRFLLGPDREE
jgi:hypothetical protein